MNCQYMRAHPAIPHRLRTTATIILLGSVLAVVGYVPVAAQSGGLSTTDLAGGTITAETLANELVGAGGGVSISNVTYRGNPSAAGTFSGGVDIIGFDAGIMLSTGNIANVKGPNNTDNASTVHAQSGDDTGDPDLAALANNTPTKDVAELSFAFVPNGDRVFFDYVFSSEEYSEYVNSDYNDVFAFYVNGTNCAVVDGTPVSINTINNGKPGDSTAPTNPQYYRDNAKNADGTALLNTQMDGLTVVLTCEAPVNRGVINTIKLVIGDTSDEGYDSNVFIRAGSLTTIPPTPTPVPPTSTPDALPPTPTPPPTIPSSTYGDVHISTPDGLVYDFQEVGEFVLLQSTTGEAVVQARQESWDRDPRVSINTAVALQVAGDTMVFSVKPARSLTINGTLTDLPQSNLTLPNGGTVTASVLNDTRADYTIVWPDGNTAARVILYTNVYLDIGVARFGGELTYEGVLGNLDGDPANDMRLRDGTQLTPPASLAQLKQFGDSWRVAAGSSLFADPLPAPDTSAAQPPLTLAGLDPATRDTARDTCQSARVTDQIALDNCTYDVAATGDEIFVESAQTYQASITNDPAAAQERIVAVPEQVAPTADAAPAVPTEDTAPAVPTEDASASASPEPAALQPTAVPAAGGAGGLCGVGMAPLAVLAGWSLLRRKKR